MEAPVKRRPTGQKKRGGGYYRVPSLKPIREGVGLSKDRLSNLSGVSRNTIIYLEDGKHVARSKTIYKLANALGIEALMLVQPPEEGDDEATT